MKRILVINNYSMKRTLRLSKQGAFPAQHCWGCDELQRVAKLRFMTFTLPPILHKLHLLRVWYYMQNIWILLLSMGCDTLYIAASPLVDLIGWLKYVGIFRKGVVMVVHHPRNFSLKRQRYDKLIFICRDAYRQAIVDWPMNRDLFIYQEWGPDLKFYGDLRANIDRVSFVGNGITDRDNNTFVEAAKGEAYEVAILCNEESIPTNYKSSYRNIGLLFNNGTMMSGKILSYKEVISYISRYSVCVIPTKAGRSTLCGLTSFCDATALGMAVIPADTTHIGVDFSRYKFGMFYRAESVDELKSAMSEIAHNPTLLIDYSKASRAYAERNDYSKFARVICETILKY